MASSLFCESPMADTAVDCANDSAVNVLANIYGNNFIRSYIENGLSPAMVEPTGADIAPIILGGLGSVALLLSLILFFCLMLSTLVTSAQDGEIFGKGSKKAVILFRLIFSVIMLLPTKSAYCLIQVFLMGMVLMSNAETNKIYHNVVSASALSNIGFASNNNSLDASTDVYGVRSFAVGFFQQAYCASLLNRNYYPTRYSEFKATPASSLYGVTGNVSSLYIPQNTILSNAVSAKPLITVTPSENSDYNQANYRVMAIVDTGGLLTPKSDTALCGSMRVFDVEQGSGSSQASALIKRDAIGLNIKEQQEITKQIALVSQKIAQDKKKTLINLTASITNWMNNQQIPYDINDPTYEDQLANINFDGLQDVIKESLKSSQSSYETIVKNNNMNELTANLVNALTNKGWTYAGGIKNRIISTQSELVGSSSRPVVSLTQPQLSLADLNDKRKERLLASMSLVQSVVRKTMGSESFTVSINPDLIANEIPRTPDEKEDAEELANRIQNSYTSFLSRFKKSLVMLILTGEYESGTPQALISDQPSPNWLNPERDVLANIQKSGEFIATTTSDIYSGLSLLKQTAILAYGLSGWSTTLNALAHSVVMIVNDVIAPVLTKVLFFLGILAPYMAVIIPSLPYFFFITGVVAWYIHILQAMSGLPFWAVMHMIPDRSFVGSQTQGYVTVIGLFLRPILTLTGLFFGYLLANPILLFVTDAFFMMQDSLMTTDSGFWSSLFRFVVEIVLFFVWLIIYCTLMLQVCYMIFGLAGTLPDSVLKWLGSGLSSGDWGQTNAKEAMSDGAKSAVSSNSVGKGQRDQNGQKDQTQKDDNAPNDKGRGSPIDPNGNAPSGGSVSSVRSGVDDRSGGGSYTGGSSYTGGGSGSGSGGSSPNKAQEKYQNLGGISSSNGKPLSNQELNSVNKDGGVDMKGQVSRIGTKVSMAHGTVVGGAVGAVKGIGTGIKGAISGYKQDGVKGAISGGGSAFAQSVKADAVKGSNMGGNMHLANNNKDTNGATGRTMDFVDSYNKLNDVEK